MMGDAESGKEKHFMNVALVRGVIEAAQRHFSTGSGGRGVQGRGVLAKRWWGRS
jgi:hypothetical protein